MTKTVFIIWFLFALTASSYGNRVVNNVAPGGGIITENLVAHLAADGDVYNTGTTQATNGQTVDTWVDASIQGNDMTEATNKPVFNANVQNGLPGIEFDGIDDIMHSAMAGLAADGEVYTVYVVAEADTIAANIAMWSISDSSGADEQNALFLLSDAVSLRARNSATFSSATTSTAVSAINTLFIATGVSASNADRKAYLNDAGEGTNTDTKNMAALDRMTIGALGDSSPGNFWDGHIFEILVYSVAHNATQQTQIYDALAAKWVP